MLASTGVRKGQVGPKMPKDGPKMGSERGRVTSRKTEGGSVPPGGSKILKIRRYEDPKLRLEVVEEAENLSARDLTRRWTHGPAN